MYQTKIYLYNSANESNGYRGTDYSQYINLGDQETEDITQELDTAEITLSGLNFRTEFTPQTKFIIDLVDNTETKYVDENGEIQSGIVGIVETKHWVVFRDTVNQPILSNDSYFDHHLSLIEPSVVAQQRLVDNIATTYKLKNVSLDATPAYPSTQIGFTLDKNIYETTDNFKVVESTSFLTGYYHIRNGKYFQLSDDIRVTNANGEIITNMYENIDSFLNVDGSYTATITFPQLQIMYGVLNTTNFSYIGDASIHYEIGEYSLTDRYNPINIYSGNIITNKELNGNREIISVGNYRFSNIIGKDVSSDGVTYLGKEWLYEYCVEEATDTYGKRLPRFYFKKYSDITAPDPMYDITIPIQKDRIYKISMSLYQFDDSLPSTGFLTTSSFKVATKVAYYSDIDASYSLSSSTYQNFDTFRNLSMADSETSCTTQLVTYDAETSEIVYASSTPYSALTLLQKAIINSGLYEKQDGVYIADVNKLTLPFYIDPDFLNELASTTIIENFYNQKNLWELMIEVGHYIHAIPELKFGSNDRFMVTFNRLGITDQSSDHGNKMSIHNSRSVENYISATSSYVSNMVQLGGVIEEWVTPKTTDNALLVSNDTAEIVTTKPIIELLEVIVKNNITGETAPLTPYIYEENVYKTLSIDYDLDPNRGIAMYYQLGTNRITGGQYQLPQANINIYSDYTFKKIIYCAFAGSYPKISGTIPTSGYWKDIKIVDYSFYVKYRTKDSVRQNHVRPDLRKYLLSSQYDKIPQHSQFNNQQDIVVDSIKFGNNVYGTLIKTGNSSYVFTEWNDNYSNLKHKGELYQIKGELYYVATVTHYRYGTYFLSTIEFSKDYNELSVVIGIPSEPRFYEISEQSLIRREFTINDLILLTDENSQLDFGNNYLINYSHLAKLIFGEGTDFAKYALTAFKGDKDSNTYSGTIGQANFYKEVLTPINAYSSENTLTYEWDMIDNYSAGDKTVDVDVDTSLEINERAYKSLRAVGYTDIYGKSELMDFYILKDIGNLSPGEIQSLPEAPMTAKIGTDLPSVADYNILASNVTSLNTNYNGRGIALLKDCREQISINYNLQLITSSDTFVISPYVFLPNKENIQLVLLSEEVNKLSSGYINTATIITPTSRNGNQMSNKFDLDISYNYAISSLTGDEIATDFSIDLSTILADIADEHFAENSDYTRVKSIAIICNVSLSPSSDTIAPTYLNKSQFILARNIPEHWTKKEALATWYIGAPNKIEVFKNRQ